MGKPTAEDIERAREWAQKTVDVYGPEAHTWARVILHLLRERELLRADGWDEGVAAAYSAAHLGYQEHVKRNPYRGEGTP
jgi:hypothetical protein